jgi:hypothetical protein
MGIDGSELPRTDMPVESPHPYAAESSRNHLESGANNDMVQQAIDGSLVAFDDSVPPSQEESARIQSEKQLMLIMVTALAASFVTAVAASYAIAATGWIGGLPIFLGYTVLSGINVFAEEVLSLQGDSFSQEQMGFNSFLGTLYYCLPFLLGLTGDSEYISPIKLCFLGLFSINSCSIMTKFICVCRGFLRRRREGCVLEYERERVIAKSLLAVASSTMAGCISTGVLMGVAAFCSKVLGFGWRVFSLLARRVIGI